MTTRGLVSEGRPSSDIGARGTAGAAGTCPTDIPLLFSRLHVRLSQNVEHVEPTFRIAINIQHVSNI